MSKNFENKKTDKNYELQEIIKLLNKTNAHLSHIDYDVKKIKESVGKKNEKNS